MRSLKTWDTPHARMRVGRALVGANLLALALLAYVAGGALALLTEVLP